MKLQDAFLKFVDEANAYSIYSEPSFDGTKFEDRGAEISNQHFDGKSFYQNIIKDVQFSKCTFENIRFNYVSSIRIIFVDCLFEKCDFFLTDFSQSELINCQFKSSRLNDVQITDSSLIDCAFQNCIIDHLEIRATTVENLSFFDCSFTACTIRTLVLGSRGLLYFIKTDIKNCEFIFCDLSKFKFRGCSLELNSFISSHLTDETFDIDCTVDQSYPNFIDLRTILQSSIVNERVLSFFGIKNSFAKDYVKELVIEVSFQSVFISYSFKDSTFATELNHKLRSKGVSTFLWQQDAPGGKRLKKIMQENIHKHDRLLFIASEHSLKSEACQFELTEGRIRQDKEWSDIFFPIHIDNYLFELNKDDIRPRDYRDEYWKNIEEIKDFNSLDFSSFRDNCINNSEFDKAVDNLIRDLRK